MKIIGAGLCGPGEAEGHLSKALLSLKGLCDDVVIGTNRVAEAEMNMLTGMRVKWYRDDREWGLHQRAMKEDLARRVASMRPDWVLMLDMDEEVAPSLTRDKLEEIANRGAVAWNFYLVDLWDDSRHYRPELCFWRTHFYKCSPDLGFDYQHGGFDPGLVPEWAGTHANHAPFIVRHYGLIKPGARRRRLARYQKYDPDSVKLPVEYYQALADDEPGQFYNEEALLERVQKDVASMKEPIKKVTPKNMQKFHYIRHKKTGVVIDVPDRTLAETLKRGEHEYVSEAFTQPANVRDVPVIDDEPTPGPIIEPPPVNELKCVICGFEGKNAKSFGMHKARAHA